MTTPLPEDAELDRTALAKVRDFRARARARLLKAETPEEKASAELSVQFGEAAVKKVLMAPHRERERDNQLAAELAALWRPMRHLTDEQQKMQAGLQQVQASLQTLASAIEAEKADRDDVRQAVGGFRADPSGAALALLAKHRAADVAKETRSLENATKKWESKKQQLEAEIARDQKILDNFHYQHDVEPDPIRRQALTRHLTEMMTRQMAVMDQLSTHLGERPN